MWFFQDLKFKLAARREHKARLKKAAVDRAVALRAMHAMQVLTTCVVHIGQSQYSYTLVDCTLKGQPIGDWRIEVTRVK